MHGRLLQLDILRAVAILFVIFYHWPDETAIPSVIQPFKRFGWSGVDLFFVLSGFLVSGLLFREYRLSGNARVGRFLIRRGFKIYPAFYVLTAATITMLAVLSGVVPNQKALTVGGVVGELVFLQNYVGSLWGHTWSLAIEEHFYLTLGIVVFMRIRRGGGGDVFRRLPVVFAVVAAACLAARIALVLDGPVHRPVQATHLRMDALTFGVLLSYLFNFHSEALARWVRARQFWILLAGAVLVLPSWTLDYYNPINLTIGLTLLYLGYGAILLVMVHNDIRERSPKVVSRFLAVFSLIGVYSYSIYLWHWPILSTVPKLVQKVTGGPPGLFVSIAIVVATILAGIIAALVVEMPFLRLRDRLFPSGPKREAPRAVPLPVDSTAGGA